MGGVAVLRWEINVEVVLAGTSEHQEQTTLRKGLGAVLVATQLMGAGFALAQTNVQPARTRQGWAIQANASPVAAASTSRASPVISISPRNLDFAPVALGRSSNLAFTVQNVGAGTLTGAARVSAPFRIVGGTPYVLESSQSQVITVQYLPQATGMNVAVIRLTGGGGASIIVSGSAVPAPPAPPARPPNLRFVARR
jgi:hypothetical protein